MSGQYASAHTIQQRYNVSRQTLRRWATQGKIRSTRCDANDRQYFNADDIRAIFHVDEPTAADARPRVSVIYARVSSDHQHADLDRQCQALQQAYPRHELIRDIGSGLNWHRPGFRALLDRVHAGLVDEVVVAHKDRLCRFAIELVQWIFEKAGTRLVVNDAAHTTSSGSAAAADPSVELADDLLAIVTVFVARNNGLRSAEHRRDRSRKRLKAASGQSEEDSAISDA